MFSTHTASPLKHRALTIAAALTLTAAAAAPIAGAATDAPATILSKVVLHAGQTAPVSVPGGHLHAGWTIRKGTELIRYRIRVNGNQPLQASLQKPITLHAPKGSVVAGLALGAHDDLGWSVHSAYYRNTIEVAFYIHPKSETGGRGYTYMLVKKA
ncbi:MAG: hypothetical protein QOJ35_2615 [Solirubrobacteraceae bacterium]|jgi:hypothetical protein|nr:hypothetical protein [Solirubrobacteraceae bacterium]